MLFKTELKHSNHAVIVIQHNDSKYLDVCTEIAHSLCNQKDLVSRLSSERLALLLADKGDAALHVFHVLAKMIEIYPWERKGLTGSLPQVMFQDILSFPFTLEQLEDSQPQEWSHGSTAQ